MPSHVGVLSWRREESALEDALALALDLQRFRLAGEFTNTQAAWRHVREPCEVVRVVGSSLLFD